MLAAPAAVFVGMRTASAERPQQTLPFLLALPASRHEAAVVKLVVGLLTCLVPLLASLIAFWCWYYVWGQYLPDSRAAMQYSLRGLSGFVNSDNWFVTAGLMTTCVTVSLYLWTIAVAVNRPDEVSAGAWSLAAMTVIWIVAFCTGAVVDHFTGGTLTKCYTWLVSAIAAVLPCGFTSTHLQDNGPAVAQMIASIFFLSHALLALWFVKRFGRAETTELRSSMPIVAQIPQQTYLAAPFSSQLAANIWKQFRESGPIALVGASAALAIALIFAIGGLLEKHPPRFFMVFGAAWFAASLYLGGIATLVIGIGVFLRDLEPGLNSFWRSRPIRPDQWFWSRFASGLGVILFTFLLPSLIIVAVGGIAPGMRAEDLRQAASMFGIAVAIFIATYAVAVAATSLLRRAMFGGLVTLAATYFGALAVVAVYVVARCFTSHQWAMNQFNNVGTSVWISGLIFDMILATLLAWLAVRYDWGRKT
jgi:ABC-type transport system involved in multi-copper enzyme maturation permease subunit